MGDELTVRLNYMYVYLTKNIEFQKWNEFEIRKGGLKRKLHLKVIFISEVSYLISRGLQFLN